MITTKGRYALRVMMDLAEHAAETCVPLKEIAERQGISKKYLEIIVKDLVKGGLIKGVGGKGGGYRLVRKPNEYNVGEIIELAEGTLATVACLAQDAEACPRAAACKTLPMWKEADELMRSFYRSKKLTDLL